MYIVFGLAVPLLSTKYMFGKKPNKHLIVGFESSNWKKEKALVRGSLRVGQSLLCLRAELMTCQ